GHRDRPRCRRPRWAEAATPDAAGETGGVARRGRTMVVVEVDVAVFVGRPQRRETFGPRVERGVAVARPRSGPSRVEPQVGPVGRPPDGAEDAAPVRQAQGRAALDEQVADLVAEPAVVAELDGDPNVGREPVEGPGETVAVAAELWGQLDEGRPELRAEAAGPPDEPLDRFRRALQPPDVGQVTTDLDGHDEVVRGALRPGLEGAPLGQPVERVVGFDGREPGGVRLEPGTLGELAGIERTSPVVVLPAGGPDPDRHRPGAGPPPAVSGRRPARARPSSSSSGP